MPRNYWMVVTSKENFDIMRGLGFTVQGIKAQHNRKVQRIEPGDCILYYIGGKKHFAATARATSRYSQDPSPPWKREGLSHCEVDGFNYGLAAVLFNHVRDTSPLLELLYRCGGPSCKVDEILIFQQCACWNVTMTGFAIPPMDQTQEYDSFSGAEGSGATCTISLYRCIELIQAHIGQLFICTVRPHGVS